MSALALALPGVCAAPASAQCTSGWRAGDPLLGVNGTVRSLQVWDRDGNGPLQPDLVVGGNFQLAGEAPTLNIARWDGSRFWPLADGLGTQPDSVYAMAVYNNELVAAGTFLTASGQSRRAIARYDGTTWNALAGGVWLDPVGARVYAMTVYNGELIVAGLIADAGGVGVRNIAAWNGTSWRRMFNGLDGAIYALHVHNGELFAGGSFQASGGIPMGRIARWTGSEWNSVGGEGLAQTGSIVYALGSFNGQLVAGGVLPHLNNLVVLSGGTWQALAGGVASNEPASVRTIVVDGPELIASGNFTSAGSGAVPANNIARYTTSQGWRPAGSGISGTALASTRFRGRTIVGGSFLLSAGSVDVGRIAAWDGATWQPIGRGMNGGVHSLWLNGDTILAGGNFTRAGDVQAEGVAWWNGSQWTSLAQGLVTTSGLPSTVRALVQHQGFVYAGGSFDQSGSGVAMRGLSRWDGSQWQDVGGGVTGSVYSLISGGAIGQPTWLIAGGSFTQAGTVNASRIARWNGSSWASMGPGFSNGTSAATVHSLAVYNGSLYAGGTFTTSASLPMTGIARWTGSAWQAVVNTSSGVGLQAGTAGATVFTMAVHNGELYVGGTFASAGGEPETRAIARWNGSRWARVGPPLEISTPNAVVSVTSLLSTSDGLIVAGTFDSCAGLPALNIARLNGSTWSAFVSGDEPGIALLQPLGALRATAQSPLGDLIVGGDIRSAGGVASAGIARWATANSGGGFGAGPGLATAPCGGTLTFTAYLAPGSEGLPVRWRKNGVLIADSATPWGSGITGSQSLAMTITNAQPQDAGAYYCELAACGSARATTIDAFVNPCTVECDTIDFNNDGLYPDDADLVLYLSILQGGSCPAGLTCNDIDFNNDGLFPDEADTAAFFRVYAGGACR